jgi:selenocysteine lyase/cysteine desulfurase
MTSALHEPSGLPGSAGNARRPEPPGFLSAYPDYPSTALLDELREAEYPYLDAGDNGEPMARIYGPANTRDRGGTIAFNLLDPDGRIVDERAVAQATAAAGISIRTGCFCNPGAGEGAFTLTKADWRRALRGRARTLDQYVDLLGLPSGGALRASVGLASNVDDVERFLALVEMTYRDRTADAGGLAPRVGC